MTPTMSKLSSAFTDKIYAVGEAAAAAVNISTKRIAITGLSRAGKTVFLVSLISNLISMGHGIAGTRRNTLPKLAQFLDEKAGEGSRLVDVQIESSGTQDFPLFDYEGLRDQLAKGAAANWPPVTDRPAMITLRLVFRRKNKIAQFAGDRILRLELLDYPGEWLMDLPLLEQSYEQWSSETLADISKAPREEYFSHFLQFTRTLHPSAESSEKTALHGYRLYRDALLRAREEAGLRWLQPGRFLMPGPDGEIPLMYFFPWTEASSPARGTLGAQLRDRFEAYKSFVKDAFFKKHFSRFNRQVVLVDILGAMFAGRSAFEDTTRALRKIGQCYSKQLESSWMLGDKIEAVAFAATKSDHVDDLQRDNLRHLLRHYIEGEKTQSGRSTFHTVASVNCTTDIDVVDSEGRTVRAVRGLPLGGVHQRPFRAGIIPSGEVQETYWAKPYFVMPQLAPPEFPAGAAYPIPHLNLDDVLAELLGDVL